MRRPSVKISRQTIPLEMLRERLTLTIHLELDFGPKIAETRAVTFRYLTCGQAWGREMSASRPKVTDRFPEAKNLRRLQYIGHS